ncbi:hypothetical protein CHY_1714 [Carboxydothermus hydrogenoformans Z-2901]|uniref:Uncharacterized protein n=1 Tax=Carboxydothermus hydrogenoformans (strain ATCC BAA-161 / DSM 6008 / Z-2901) TaxID=246194 RepID=Q3ABF0_CARHZ|nr:hypothetical protein CHY_1714 [Carboxydothermus hydrogenoformans Z-2901]
MIELFLAYLGKEGNTGILTFKFVFAEETKLVSLSLVKEVS